ncbi:MAG: type I-D CRISPR-associated helicase Cas3' [Spirulinaceae cyanobacterium]
MKICLKPLYMRLNPGVGQCKLGCTEQCQVHQAAPGLKLPDGHTCPLYQHQIDTYHEVTEGNADVIFVEVATGGGKTLGAALPSLMDAQYHTLKLFPTIELVEDQYRQEKNARVKLFGPDSETAQAFEEEVDLLYGSELSRRVRESGNTRAFELKKAIAQIPVVLTNPDLFHYITHARYFDPARSQDELPVVMATFPKLWVFDEFHIFGAHQEAAVLNSICLIRRSQNRQKRFVFTSATPKASFVDFLKKSGLSVTEIQSEYSDESHPDYRQILQPIELELVSLKEQDAQGWLVENLEQIKALLNAEASGRGLVIVNSVAMAGRITRELQALIPQSEIDIREVSGRVDRATRQDTQHILHNSPQPVLVIATSAVDVGVDFNIHLLIFESSDAATVTQRLGRLGRHEGFTAYQAYLLIPERTPWVKGKITKYLKAKNLEDQDLSRGAMFDDLIAEAFNAPQEFEKYREKWGALQGFGMLEQIKQANSNRAVSEGVRSRIYEDLQLVYDESALNRARGEWFGEYGSQKGEDKNKRGEAIRDELLRFRGGSSLQAGVWDENRFYTYDLLRLLPYAEVEVVQPKVFEAAVEQQGLSFEDFPAKYLCAYFKIQQWRDERQPLTLFYNCLPQLVETGKLTLLDRQRLFLEGPSSREVTACVQSQKQLLAFLIPVDPGRRDSHWQVSRKLNLSPLFGLYRLTDNSGGAYACAFNQDALLLAALNWHSSRLKSFFDTYGASLLLF